MKKISFYFIFILLFSVIFNSCNKDEEEFIPPPLPIINEDTTGTLGNLTCNIYYYHGTVSPAPSKTEVHLYASAFDLDHGFPLYQTWTGTSNTIYFGYLNPIFEYYVLAFNRIGSSDYEMVKRVIVYAGMHTEANVTMEKLPTE